MKSTDEAEEAESKEATPTKDNQKQKQVESTPKISDGEV
jgi:hypothetical protein